VIRDFIAVAVVLGIAASGPAQGKPDFSGEWILNRAASTLSPAASGTQSGTVRIDHKEPKVQYKATFNANGNPFEYAFELTTDGTELSGTQQGRRSVSSLRWDGDVLVFLGKLEGPDADRTISLQFRYEIVDGHLRAVEHLRGGGRDQDNVWIFDRR